MPRKKDTVKVVQIGGEDVEIRPIVGAKNAAIVMELISITSEIIVAAGRSGIDLRPLMNGEVDSLFDVIKVDNLIAFKYVGDMLSERWNHLVEDIFPILLGKDVLWMEENGSPFEYYAAFIAALELNAPHIFGNKIWTSIKKLLAGESEETQEETEDQPQTD